MDYNPINGFLDKFRKIIFQKEEIKNVVIKIISEAIAHQIENNSVKIKNGIIFIQGSPMLRSEILMRKEKIILKLKEYLPDNKFLDIK